MSSSPSRWSHVIVFCLKCGKKQWSEMPYAVISFTSSFSSLLLLLFPLPSPSPFLLSPLQLSLISLHLSVSLFLPLPLPLFLSLLLTHMQTHHTSALIPISISISILQTKTAKCWTHTMERACIPRFSALRMDKQDSCPIRFVCIRHCMGKK